MAPPTVEHQLDGSDQGTWREWARHVLLELQRNTIFQEQITAKVSENRSDIDTKLQSVRQEIQASVSRAQEANSKDLGDLKVEIAMLKVRAGVWGAVGAAIPICITIAVALLVHYLTKKAGG